MAGSANAEIPAALQQAYTDIALSLYEAVPDHQMYKACRDSSMKALEELASLKTKKSNFLAQFQAITSS